MLAVDLCCGRGGWAKGFIAAGFCVVGYDLKNYGYPGHLVMQDIRTVSGVQMRGRVRVIVASPPCTELTEMWNINKTRSPQPSQGIELVQHCFRIASEAGCPIVLENVRGAQRFIGYARAHAGSFYLWGDVPALLPTTKFRKGIWNTKAMRGRPGHRSPALRAEIPFELALHIARCFNA
jgi:hypothetical protein